MSTQSRVLGLSSIAMAIGFNLPYAQLVAIYDYPDILRRPAAEALTLFAHGGSSLILTWHCFAFAALLLVPLAVFLSFTPANRMISERLALMAALSGALSGVTQAMGLWRWVFVIPGLAQNHAEGDSAGKAAAEGMFTMLNSYGGVAIGEHLGQWLLVFFILSLSLIQWRQHSFLTAVIGFLTSISIGIGTTEGLMLALGLNGEIYSLFTIAGFLGLSLWLILIGLLNLGALKPAQRTE